MTVIPVLFDQAFARPLPDPPGTVHGEPFALDPETQREVDEKLRAIDEARAAAVASASTYVVWR